MDNSSHNVRIISPNADARLDLLQFILQIEDLTNHANDHPDTKGTGAKLSRLLKGRVLRERILQFGLKLADSKVFSFLKDIQKF